MAPKKDWRHQMDYAIEVNVCAQVYGRLTDKGSKAAKEQGEPVAEIEVQDGQDTKKEPVLYSLQISTDQKMQPQYVTIYSPVAGKPLSMSCVEFELLMRMYQRGSSRLKASLALNKKEKVQVPDDGNATGSSPPAGPSVPEHDAEASA